MSRADRTHRADLAINQFNTVIFCQDASLHHPGEVGDSELPAENFDSHIFSQHKQ
jgi:hypothetical protein